MEGGHQNSVQVRTEGIVRIMSCFICRNLTLTSFKKAVLVRNGYLSPIRSISVVMK